MGRIFGIFEIHTPSRENSKIINQVLFELEQKYYSFFEESLSPAVAFEQTLKYINTHFLEIIHNNTYSLVGNLNEYTIREKVHFVIGVLHGKDLHLTSLNTVGALLLHKSNQDYKALPIIENEEPIEGTQLFNTVVSGQVQPGDYIFFCNKDFSNYISKERIIKTVTSLPPHKAADYFKNSLLQLLLLISRYLKKHHIRKHTRLPQ
jgi:hypothetical protein